MHARSICFVAGCSRLQPCLTHQRKPWPHRLPSKQERGYGYEYLRLRKRVLEREPLCYVCHAAPSTTVDHELPLAEGGTHAEANLRGCCARCQQSKAGREGARARARMIAR
jgi:5-methylcytosine-specific restriction enzyme A